VFAKLTLKIYSNPIRSIMEYSKIANIIFICNASRQSVPKPLNIPHLKAKINLFSSKYLCNENIFSLRILMMIFRTGNLWLILFIHYQNLFINSIVTANWLNPSGRTLRAVKGKPVDKSIAVLLLIL